MAKKYLNKAISFLSKLFNKESEQVRFKEMPASLKVLSASNEDSCRNAGNKP